MFAIAFVARLSEVWHGPGLSSDLGYDPGVYFAAADGLVHGRLPYRDFVLLHPPGLMLALSPFAVATRWVSDESAFIAANLTFTGLGAFNAAFVVGIGRKLGLGPVAAVSGGIIAALWLGSVHAEDVVRLEPLANFFVLVALYALAAARRGSPTRWLFVMGAALGLATSVKIWYVVPLVVVLGWTLVRVRDRRATAAAGCGAAAALIATNAVFFALAPSSMWHMVVTEQLGRGRFNSSPLARFAQAYDLANWNRVLGVGPATVGVVVIVVIAAVLLRAAWADPTGRMLTVLVGVQVVVMVMSPSWFAFYADYLTPALALALAIGVANAVTVTVAPVSRRRIAGAAAVVGLVVLVVPLTWQRIGFAFPGPELTRAAGASRCVTSDTPMALIELDALSRSFSAGCRDWVDVAGRLYGPDRAGAPRAKNPRWQRDVKNYLLSGDAFIVIRSNTGLSALTRAELQRTPVIARVGSFVLHQGLGGRS